MTRRLQPLGVTDVRALLTLAWLGACASCSAYNECTEKKGEIIGYTAIELDLRERALRYREMPVGNLITDAFYEVAFDNCGATQPCPDFAVENAGAIRSFTESGCDRRDSIEQGPIRGTDIDSILPFATNHLVMVQLTGQDIRLMLEHAVDRLTEINTNDTSGWFMQVSHLSFSVDCDQDKHLQSADGEQVVNTGRRISSVAVRRDDAGGERWEPVDLDDGVRTWNVVTNDFIGNARDGHLGFALRDSSERVRKQNDAVMLRPQQDVLDKGKTFNDSYAVKRYIRNRAANDEDVAPLVERRITLASSCFRRVQ